jgi:hypothetical protein
VTISTLEATQLLIHAWKNLVMVNLKQSLFRVFLAHLQRKNFKNAAVVFALPVPLVACNICEEWGKYFN